jgi:DNA-binding LacI/PurR family transcriptional regulator
MAITIRDVAAKAGVTKAVVSAVLNERQTTVYDGAAIKMLHKAREWGLRVPEDLSVIGFDSTAQCLLTTPTLTSVRQPIHEIADLAATMLIQRIRGEEVFQTRRLFAPTVDERGSCKPFHTGTETVSNTDSMRGS